MSPFPTEAWAEGSLPGEVKPAEEAARRALLRCAERFALDAINLVQTHPDRARNLLHEAGEAFKIATTKELKELAGLLGSVVAAKKAVEETLPAQYDTIRFNKTAAPLRAAPSPERGLTCPGCQSPVSAAPVRGDFHCTHCGAIWSLAPKNESPS